MIGQASNPMLAQAEQGIQAKVPANLQAALQKVIHAGLTIMYSPQLTQQRNQHMATSKNPPQDAGQGAARLIGNLYQQSNKTLPVALIGPAAMIFAIEYLDLLAKAGKAQITPDLIAQTAQAVSAAVLPMLHATPDKIQKLTAMVQQKQAGTLPAAGQPAPAAPTPPAGLVGQAQAGA